jgi:hypothetical protein
VLDAEAIEAARSFGYKGRLTPQKPASFKIWPENWESVMVAKHMITQIRLSATGKLLGFDYTALPIVEERLNYQPEADRFYRLQAIEQELIRVYNA